MVDTNNRLRLAEVIEDLRKELLDAIALGAGQPFHFKLQPLEVEFQIGVTTEAGGSAGIQFWVFKMGGEASTSNAVTHKLKLVLEPVYPDGQPVLVGGVAEKS